MSIYVYARVSSSSQKNDSQLSEIKKEIGENKIKYIFWMLFQECQKVQIVLNGLN